MPPPSPPPPSASHDAPELGLKAARTLLRAGRLIEAEVECRLLLMTQPEHLEIGLILSAALSAQGRLREALESQRTVCVSHPHSAAARATWADGLLQVGDLATARAVLEEGLRTSPDEPTLLRQLATTLAALRDPLAEATRHHSAWAHSTEPAERLAAAYRWGMALQDAGKSGLAARAYREVLRIDPGHTDAALNLANIFHANGLLTEAGRRYAGLLAQRPDDVRAMNNQANVLRDAGLVAEALALQRRAVSLDPDLDALQSNLLNTLQYLPGVTPTMLMTEALQWGRHSMVKAQRRLGHTPQRPKPQARSRPPLRVGYVSSDLWMHAVGLFARSVITAHNPQAVIPFLYAHGGRRDGLSAELREAVIAKGGRWHEVADWDDLRLSQQIRADGIDILIDLTGHTAGSRIAMFAYRPCPVQISWLGYYATTGSPAVDYVILDPWHAPPGTETQFTETVLRLPHNRFCYTPVELMPDVGSPPALARGYVTFGSFNNTAKLNAEVLETWARILNAVPDSRLLLKWRTFGDSDFSASVRGFFVSRGIQSERIDLRNASPHPEMLAEYREMDIALDPFPFSGGHTSCEALWMGVPIITLPQERVVSRQTLSFLAALGLERMAARDRDDYVARAIQLAGNAALRGQLRRTLRQRMQGSTLCDTVGFTRDVEALLVQAWRRTT